MAANAVELTVESAWFIAEESAAGSFPWVLAVTPPYFDAAERGPFADRQRAALAGLGVIDDGRINPAVVVWVREAIETLLDRLKNDGRPALTANGAADVNLESITAVVIGGTLLTGGYGFVAGTFIGVMLQGLVQTYIVFDGTLSSWWTKIVVGVLLFMFIVLQRLVFRAGPRRT